MKERLEWTPLVVGAMLACIVLAAASLVGMIAQIGGVTSGWHPAYFVGACALAVLEAYYGRRLRRRWERSVEGAGGWRLIALEFLLFVVLLKLGSYAGDAWTEILADVQSWAREPSRILDGETLLAFIMAALSWLTMTQTLDDLENLGEAPEFWSDAQSGAAGMPVPQARLARRFLAGGVVLLLLTALTWLGANVSQGWSGIGALWSGTFANQDTAVFPIWQAVNVLAYFCLGLVLLSQVRLVALRQDWTVQQTAVAGGLGKTWWRYSLVFVGLVAAAALLLPTGYTTGLLDVLRYGLTIVLNALYWFVSVLMLLLSLPFFLIARWIFGEDVPVPSARPRTALRTPALPASSGGPAWLEIVRAVFFWLVLVALGVYLVRSFLKAHPEIQRALASFRPLRWLLQVLKSWWARLALWRAPRARLRRRRAVAGEGQDGSSATLVDAREPEGNRGRVRYYYMDVVRRAKQSGYPRRPSQTPLSYGAMLGQELPETREQVELLTDSFVEARYSRHPIETDLVHRVRAGWQRIKQSLGGKRGNRD